MSHNARIVRCTPETLFETLADGWLYPVWVVGASRMRDVDTTWPEPGSRIHHSLGVWPWLIDDETTCLEYEPDARIVLEPKGGVVGRGIVTITVRPHTKGCVVRMQEAVLSGPGLLVAKPLLHAALRLRNRESLKRLAFISEGRQQTKAANRDDQARDDEREQQHEDAG